MGLFDADDSFIIGKLLGGAPAAPPPGPPPMDQTLANMQPGPSGTPAPMPPPDFRDPLSGLAMPAPGPPQEGPSFIDKLRASVQAGGALAGGGGGVPPQVPAMPAPSMPGSPMPGPGGIGSDAARTPDAAQPPWPPESPALSPGATPAAGPPIFAMPPGMGPTRPPLPSGPPGGAPPPAPSGGGGAGPGGWLANTFGGPQAVSRMLGGLGAGLKSVGQNWNKPGLAAAAGSAGSAIEGADKQQMQNRKQNFVESNAAFRNMILALNQRDMEKYRDAQSEWLSKRGNALAAGAPGRNQYQNTPEYRVLRVEALAMQAEKQAAINERAAAKAEFRPVDDAKIKAAGDARRQQLYASLGMNPQQVEQIKNRGTTQANPYQPRSAQELHALVPPAVEVTDPATGKKTWQGGWYVDPGDGKPKQFTKPDFDKFGPHRKTSAADKAGNQQADWMAMNPERGPAVGPTAAAEEEPEEEAA